MEKKNVAIGNKSSSVFTQNNGMEQSEQKKK